MAFGGQFTRLSQLIADTITGVTIIGGNITGAVITATNAVLTNPDITGGTQTNPDITGGNQASIAQTGGTITGAVITATGSFVGRLRTALTGARWELGNSGQEQTLNGFTGTPTELSPATITLNGTILQMTSALFSTLISTVQASWYVDGDSGTGKSRAVGTADVVDLIDATVTRFIRLNNLGALIGSLSSTPIKAITFGNWSGTTNASGQITALPHGLGTTPAVIFLNQSGGSGTGRVRATATPGATTFVVQVNNTTTGAAFAAGSAFSGEFVAIA